MAQAYWEPLKRAATAGVKASVKLLDGSDAEAIEDESRAYTADVIVMGRHARSGISRLVLCSKTEGVLLRNAIPVRVAPHITSVRDR